MSARYRDGAPIERGDVVLVTIDADRGRGEVVEVTSSRVRLRFRNRYGVTRTHWIVARDYGADLKLWRRR